MTTKIVSIVAERFKILKAVYLEIGPKGLIIGGGNKQGKTTVLDLICYALGGAAFCPSEPQNRDEKKPPYLRVELSNGMIAERSGKNGSLKVTDPEGGSGQGVLDAVIEKLALNLPKFLNASAKGKAATLLKIIGVGDQLQALDDEEKEAYDERRLIGRDVDRLEIELKAMDWHDDLQGKMEPMSTKSILADIEKISKIESEVAGASAGLEVVESMIDRDEARIKKLREDLKDLRADINGQKERREAYLKIIEETFIPSSEPLHINLASAEEYNAKIRDNQDYTTKNGERDEKRREHAKLEGKIQEVRESRDELLDSVDMPLPGLSVVEGELVYLGDQWDGTSGSDRLKVATAIVRKLNPECGFVLLDKLEQMDIETLTEFGEWAEAEGLQIIGTRVSLGSECGVIIEDGEIAN